MSALYPGCSAYSHDTCDSTVSAMTDRRKNQNYHSLPHYLTNELWTCISTDPREKSQVKLYWHAWVLGLRCPSEMTFAVMDMILRLHGPSEMARKASSFDRYHEIGEMKKHWRRFKQSRIQAGEDTTYTDYMEQLPRECSDLPAEYYLAAFQYEAPEPCRHWNGSICWLDFSVWMKPPEVRFHFFSYVIPRYTT